MLLARMAKPEHRPLLALIFGTLLVAGIIAWLVLA